MAITKILTENPNKVIGLNKFSDLLNAAKSTISEDIVIVREILEKLDAKQHTLVNLVLSEENYLMIGGGGGKYVVTGEENGIIFNLINPKAGSTLKIELNTGGQIGLFESKYILSKEIAFKCAVKCLTMGCIPQNDLDLSWEKY